MAGTKTSLTFGPDYAVPPGSTLQETIDELGMTQVDLAARLELSAKHVNRIIKGLEPITAETAIGLERVTNVPAHFWNNREAIYRERLARIKDAQELVADLAWLKQIPTKELIGRGAIPDDLGKTALLQETLRFFGVSSVRAWKKIWLGRAVAARRSPCIESKPGPATAWLRLGELAAREIHCTPHEASRFSAALDQIRALTMRPPADFGRQMQELCASSGVAVVFVQGIKGAPWHGASRWLTPSKAMIELSLRYTWDDQFWFSFFHEAAHVLYGSKKDILINDQSEDDPREREANEFAANFLIPPKRVSEVRRLKSQQEVLALARELGISPGIVVGRFQRETRRWTYFNRLKKRFVWSDN